MNYNSFYFTSMLHIVKKYQWPMNYHFYLNLKDEHYGNKKSPGICI